MNLDSINKEYTDKGVEIEKAVYLPNCIKWCMYGQIYGFGF